MDKKSEERWSRGSCTRGGGTRKRGREVKGRGFLAIGRKEKLEKENIS